MMGHKLDTYDKLEIKDNMNDYDDLLFVVQCLVGVAYETGYEEGYNASKEDE